MSELARTGGAKRERSGLLVLRALPLAAAAAWLLRGDEGGAVVLAALGLAALAVPLLRPPAALDRAFLVAVAIATLGEVLGLYDDVAWFDSLVHAGVGLVAAPIAFLALPLSDSARSRAAVVVLVVALGAVLGVAWELLEAAADAVTGSDLQESPADTRRDLAADVAGALLGALLLGRGAQAGASPKRAMRRSEPR